MSKIEKLEEEIKKLEKKLEVMKMSVEAANAILRCSHNEKLRLRAVACLEGIQGISSGNKNIGYDLERTHECIFRGEKKGWIEELTDFEYSLYQTLAKGFDEVYFIMGNTRYDEYDNGHFFRRS